jgi:predicted RNA binding protein YcfA (HicA-like mRNA interferase family)
MAPTMKVHEIVRLLEQDGWYLVASKGSHMHYKHGKKPGRVTVAGKASKDMAAGTLIAILKQAGLRK